MSNILPESNDFDVEPCRSQLRALCRLRSVADVTRAMQAAGKGGPMVADHRGSVAGQRKASHMAPLQHVSDGVPGERVACTQYESVTRDAAVRSGLGCAVLSQRHLSIAHSVIHVGACAGFLKLSLH